MGPGEGRHYEMGRISAIFKSDGKETASKYSVSEWWLDAKTKGPGIHSHEEDDVFFVIEGVMSFYLSGKWFDAAKGSFILAPAGMRHDFENRSSKKAGVLNFSIPGNFEESMPDIVQWYHENPPADTA